LNDDRESIILTVILWGIVVILLGFGAILVRWFIALLDLVGAL